MKRKIFISATSILLLLAVAFGVYFMSGCRKDVEPIELVTNINVSSFVFNSETFAGISDVDISVDGTTVTASDANGKFTISNLRDCFDF